MNKDAETFVTVVTAKYTPPVDVLRYVDDAGCIQQATGDIEAGIALDRMPRRLLSVTRTVLHDSAMFKLSGFGC